jgi:hypothetical protein
MFTPFQQPKLDASASNQDVAAQASRILATSVRRLAWPDNSTARRCPGEWAAVIEAQSRRASISPLKGHTGELLFE